MIDLDSYLAGVFDGEGYISAQTALNRFNHRIYSRLSVGVGMISAQTIEAFRRRFGGAHYLSTQKSGRILHTWIMSGANAVEPLAVFSELCVVKRDQAVLALMFARYLKEGRAAGKRPGGSRAIPADEALVRSNLCREITRLKKVDA